MTDKRIVKISRRFQRAVRIDADFASKDALTGYVPVHSAVEALERMGTQVSQSSQRAYTWTGPYGGGKSSLALVLGSLLDFDAGVRKAAQRALGEQAARRIQQSFKLGSDGWMVVPVVGGNHDIVCALDAALSLALARRYGRRVPKTLVTTDSTDGRRLISRISACSKVLGESGNGILIIVDEMGKFLEHAAANHGDIYFLQELAENLSRLPNRVALVGILHQAFEQYASRLGQEAREEWAKIQGRFVDVPLATGPEEVVGLIAEAIVSDSTPKAHTQLSAVIAKSVLERRAGTSKDLSRLLDRCWPLHPIVPLLLAALSRRRFGQNERSTFGFLCSSEPGGFQEYARHSRKTEGSYGLEELWNYLRQNLEPAIMASSDSHRWAQAVEALDRAQAKGSHVHLSLIKSIALIDMFGLPVGLQASTSLLQMALPTISQNEIESALDDLRRWSIAVYRSHASAWSLFAGSDFDIDIELSAARSRVQVSYDSIQSILTHQTILAKKHYYERGTLRWFDVRIAALAHASLEVDRYEPSAGACGLFLLTLPSESDRAEDAQEKCASMSKKSSTWPFFVGVSRNAWAVHAIALDLAALESVRVTAAALEGDLVARREVAGRISDLRQRVDKLLSEMLANAAWYREGKRQKLQSLAELSRATSECADHVFKLAPVLRNELVNRGKPSSNAVAASNELMRRMVEMGDRLDLGFEGFPPERAIYVSLLKISGIHRKESKSHLSAKFDRPAGTDLAPSFAAFWDRGEGFLHETADGRHKLSELYKIWAAPPFGMRLGVIPIFALALLLARESQIAVYLDDQFVPRIDTFFVDRMLQSPEAIEVRKFAVGNVHRQTLKRLSTVLSEGNPATTLDALSVAKPLVGFVRSLHAWVRRTRTLDGKAIAVRDAILSAHDPLQLLFEDLPAGCGIARKGSGVVDVAEIAGFATTLRQILDELRAAYPRLLDRLGTQVEKHLGGTLRSEEGRFRLSERAGKVVGLSGDFRLDAFATRLKSASDSVEWLESVGGLAANKPVRDWIDADIERATFEIADLSARFKRVEAVANTLGPASGTETIAVVVGRGSDTRALIQTIDISESDREVARKVVAELRVSLRNLGLSSAHAVAVVSEVLREVITERTDTLTQQEGIAARVEEAKRWPH